MNFYENLKKVTNSMLKKMFKMLTNFSRWYHRPNATTNVDV